MVPLRMATLASSFGSGRDRSAGEAGDGQPRAEPPISRLALAAFSDLKRRRREGKGGSSGGGIDLLQLTD